MCWHTGFDKIDEGWRCGTNEDLFDTAYERLIFHADRPPRAVAVPVGPGRRAGGRAWWPWGLSVAYSLEARRCYDPIAVASPAPSKQPATYADLEALPPHVIGQIVDGELVVHPRPATPHALAATILTEELGAPFRRGRGGPGGWIFLFEPELHLRGDVLVPDLAGWRRERMQALPDAAFVTLPPDWVCEIVSPSSSSTDRVKKPRIYARERVAHVWLIDPIARTLEILRLDGDGYRHLAGFEGDEAVRAEPFDAVELALSALWNA